MIEFNDISNEEKHRLSRNGCTEGATIPDVLPNRAKNLAMMRDAILNYGGHAVLLDTLDPDTSMVLRSAQYQSGIAVVLIPGEESKCHHNAIREYWGDRENTVLFTGYAADETGVWVRHSWIERNDALLETTSRRLAYYGVRLTSAQAELFASVRAGAGLDGPMLSHNITSQDYQREMQIRSKGPGTPLCDLRSELPGAMSVNLTAPSLDRSPVRSGPSVNRQTN